MSAQSNLNTLNSITNFFSKIVKHRVPHLRDTPTESLLSSLSICNLSTLRLKTDFKFMHNTLNSFNDCPELISLINFRVPPRVTRGHTLFHQPFPRLSLAKRSLFFRLPSLLNSLPESIDPFSQPTNTFINLSLTHFSRKN
jgi:hypothetical protein